MSLGSIDIFIQHSNFLNKEDFFKEMTSCGWKFYIDNEIIYCEDLDDPSCDWVHFPLNEHNKIIDRAIEQLEKYEKIGISMTFFNEYGWFAVVYRDFSKITFLHEVGRKHITQIKVTDFSFHLEYIVSSFTKAGITISEIECNWLR